jgi:hypothetical protein
LGTFYTIDSEGPVYQIGFVSTRAGELNESGEVPSTSLYSCRLDGTSVRRLTFNPSSDMDPTVLPDGRLLFSSWQRSTLEWGWRGRISLFAAQTDGLDYALFAGNEGRRIKRMPCVTKDRLVVFVEGDRAGWDGSGSLASVSLRRNMSSYRRITPESAGLFHSPSPLADGRILVSRRPNGGVGTHAVYRMDPRSGQSDKIFDDPDHHDIQAKSVAPRPEPDGRSSVLSEAQQQGTIYCLDVYRSDLGRDGWIAPGTAKRLRVLEGIPRTVDSPTSAAQPLIQRRFLGEVLIERDGSFNATVPANLPIQLQLLDAEGRALRSCGWIWVRNRETRGCIGCHEDPESTPKNRFAAALERPSVTLTLPPEKRRTVDFRRDVMPILSAKCATAGCHANPTVPPLLGEGPDSPRAGPGGARRAYEALLAGFWVEDGPRPLSGPYVHPGRARTSPLVWHIFGVNTSRPWDARQDDVPRALMPPKGSEPLSAGEKRTLVEWIDLGALWDGIPPDDVSHTPAKRPIRGGGR